MTLTAATDDHVRALMAWFPDRRSCAIWGGPAFRYPFTEATFLADTRFRDLPSYVLVDEEGQVLAFGQYYQRAGRCHFGRLVVSPVHRGLGVGGRLIVDLAAIGTRRLGVDECSLFVVEDNAPAIRLYERLGFAPAVYPEDDPSVLVYVYMVVAARALGASQWPP